jgi:nucleoid-associated protein YgaU
MSLNKKGSLEKATIKRYIPPGETIEVLFNPNEYSINKTNAYAEEKTQGMAAPLLQFNYGDARTLSMKLFFDTYDRRSDVREYTGKIMKLLEIDRDFHAPPVCFFNWGQFSFVGVLWKADQHFTLFLSDGIPVRATMDVTFKEYFEAEKQAGRLQSATYTKSYVVRSGDTLSGIADQKYNDPAHWRIIAEENHIDDPLAIQPGQLLIIPSLE